MDLQSFLPVLKKGILCSQGGAVRVIGLCQDPEERQIFSPDLRS